MRLVQGVAVACAVALTACGFPLPEDVGSADSDASPAIDSLPGSDTSRSVDACVSFASQLDTCQLGLDGDLLLTDGAIYDTTSHVLTVNGVAKAVSHTVVTISGAEVDVLSAHNIRVGSGQTLRGIGTRALAIVVSDSLTVEFAAQIDVSAGGAGAATSCTDGPTVGADGPAGAGGGGGGGFGADGGSGGEGGLNGPLPHPSGGSKGHAASSTVVGLRGGCPGTSGGTGKAPGGAGGTGGGGLYIAAANFIELDSAAPINAGGGGGQGGQHGTAGGSAGGGGGGSGGMLLLEAPHVMGTAAVLAANGGGGGEGSDTDRPGNGGNAGSATTSRTRGGVNGANDGVDGGFGGSLEVAVGENVTALLAGGGGGGGGVGIIRIVSPDLHILASSPMALR